MKEQKTATELIEEMDKRNAYLDKLEKIREERKELKSSSFNPKMKKQIKNDEDSQ